MSRDFTNQISTTRRNFAKRIFTIYRLTPNQLEVLQDILHTLRLTTNASSYSTDLNVIGILCEDPIDIPRNYEHAGAARDFLKFTGYFPGKRHGKVKFYLPENLKDAQTSSKKVFDSEHCPNLCKLIESDKTTSSSEPVKE